MTSFFSRGRSDLDKIAHTGAELYVDCGDMKVACMCLMALC